ncbi:MAG: penicillin-binding protein [Candidatus Sumerlaeota bacterium]|nr:penicillin-binding protein [Candidatus Sumerlaeota bacterium]
MAILFLIAFPALWYALYRIQVLQHDHWVKKALGQQIITIQVMPHRGRIIARTGEELAISKISKSIYIEPGRITSQHEIIASRLGEMLEIPSEPILATLEKYQATSSCLPVARKVEIEGLIPKVQAILKEFNLEANAISLREDSKRQYPRSQLAAHVVGTTKMDQYGDNKGKEGIELQYDSFLHGEGKQIKIPADAARQGIEPVDEEEYLSTFGADVRLTIDSDIQSVAERELLRMINEQMALGGTIVVMACSDGKDYQRGAILAMANIPTYDLNQPAEFFMKRNRAVTDPIETGSVMKTFLVADLLENELAAMDEIINCQGGHAVFNGKKVDDTEDHSLHQIPVFDVYKFSSNVGCVTLAQRIEPKDYVWWLRRFGFGEKTGLDFPGECPGKLPGDWNNNGAVTYVSLVDRDRSAIGYSVGVTAVQVAAAVAAIGNEGLSVQPHLVKEIRDVHHQIVQRFEPQRGQRIIKSVTAKKVWKMMEGVVEEGTGAKARIPTYRIGGKTGTAQKFGWDPVSKKKMYLDKYVASFICLAPIDDPRLAIYCYIDEPKKDKYGGKVAAPVVREVAYVALRAIGVMPTSLQENKSEDFDLMVDSLRSRRQSADAATLAERSKQDKTVPDVTGLTMAEASAALAPLSKELEFAGSGVAVSQTPSPDTPLDAVKKIMVTFGLSNETNGVISVASKTTDTARAKDDPPKSTYKVTSGLRLAVPEP